MISSLALAHPAKTIDKFLPFCLSQIRDELKHGASSIRTTSSHVAIPSDTTLHWSAASSLLGYSFINACFVQTCQFFADVSATTALWYV
jgi:proteasome activator subunit 4